MAHQHYRKLLNQAEYETLHGTCETRREAGGRNLSQVREAHRQVSEDREQQILQWRVLKEAWKEPYRPAQEPVRDEVKALLRVNWHLCAFLLAVIEVVFAFWFASTYLEIPVLPAGRLLRALVLTVPGLLLAVAASLLFHNQMAVYDDEKKPKKAFRRFAGIATLSSLTGLTAIGAFLLTRHLLSDAQVLMAGLGGPTVGLAAGVAASLHCAEILHRPNRLAARYEASSKLLGRLEDLLERIGSQAAGSGDARAEAGIRRGAPGAVERAGDLEGDRPVRRAIRPDGG